MLAFRVQKKMKMEKKTRRIDEKKSCIGILEYSANLLLS
jgi:hypothetical protein